MSDTLKRYTLHEVKAAFWETFHKSGEIFFPYDDDNDAERTTVSSWEEFTDHLAKPAA